MNWSISSWSLRTRRSYILKHGTESDKDHVNSESNGRNRPRGKRSRLRSLKDRPLYPSRQRNMAQSKLARGFQEQSDESTLELSPSLLLQEECNNRTDRSFAQAFPPPKSPHQNYTCQDCHIGSNLFFKKSSEKRNGKSCSSDLHHVCMIKHGSKTHGEKSEKVGMLKTCKSCYDTSTSSKGITKI